jgi:putative ATPase
MSGGSQAIHRGTASAGSAFGPRTGVIVGLFDQLEQQNIRSAEPLAARMRPRSLDEFVGQSHLLGPGRILRRMVDADRLVSVVLYGPPGTGKTSLAGLLARQTGRKYIELNAAVAGVKELREVLEASNHRLAAAGERTLLFVDELHHFNKQQQNVLLPDVESGVVSLVAATTANPFFSLIAPLVSRSQILELQPLSIGDIEGLLSRALADSDRGLGYTSAAATPEALRFLATICDGDARRALNSLELAVLTLPRGEKQLSLAIAEESVQKKAIRYDKQGDDHYDAASALIKSIRGSDPDAALYWMARMLEAGEDPRFIGRRLMISASEDIGNADPQALVIATSAVTAFEQLGLPEGRIPLFQAVVYLAMAPKSNASYVAGDAAIAAVREQRLIPVPVALRDKSYSGAKRLGHGTGYQYTHNAAGGWAPQDYLGVDAEFYQPSTQGIEAAWIETLRQRRQLVREARQAKGSETTDSSDGQ